MTPELTGFAIGLVIAVLTSPVGISGAVFLLPVQLDVLHVPSPQVTPTNLLFNIVAIPGGLLRYSPKGTLRSPLTMQLVAGTLPGVVAGATIRVLLVPGVKVFRIIAGFLLLPLGAFVISRRPVGTEQLRPNTMRRGRLTSLAALVGTAGGVYGIGGGSILGPILVGRGYPVSEVAPAALTTTFVTSVAGASTYAILALLRDGAIAPDWSVGLACGVGGFVGGYIGARVQPRLPEAVLRNGLGVLAIALGSIYLIAGLT